MLLIRTIVNRYGRLNRYGCRVDTRRSSRGSDQYRLTTFWPLPGGSGNYLKALSAFVDLAKGGVERERFIAGLMRRCPGVTSPKAANSYLRVAVNLGFLDCDGRMVTATSLGRTFRRTRNRTLVYEALVDRVAGVEELLRLLADEPTRIGILRERMAAEGYQWATASQIRYRLRWLEEAGAVKQEGLARPIYSIAPKGPAASLADGWR